MCGIVKSKINFMRTSGNI